MPRNASSLRGDPKSSGHQHIGSSVLAQAAIGACVFLIFLTLLGWKLRLGERLPGDLGDSRLNMYVLEHYFLWISDGTSSFSSPGILYPYPNILFFSDTHVGTSWIYCIFRAIGLDTYMAFKAWFFTGYALTYAAAYFVFTRLATPPWIAALGAALFAFGLPSIAQFTHAQLVYRCGVPLAMLALWQWCQTGRIKSLLLSVFWLNVQMLISVYLGVFLALLMGLFCLAFFVTAPKRLLRLGEYFDVRDALRHITVRGYFAATGWVAVTALTIFILYRHHEVDRQFGLTRPWSEISDMLPRPASYLMSKILPYYRIVHSRLSIGVPMAHEHNMFVGMGTLGLFVAGFFGLRSQNAQFARLALAASLLIVLLVTQFGAFSAYQVLATLPGLNAIRVVTRVILILLFPVSAVAVKGLEYLCRDGAAQRLRFVLCGTLVLVFAIEVEASKKPAYPVSESEARIRPLLDQAKARGASIEHPVLATTSPYGAGYEAAKVEMDAGLVAQRLGWPTINGYSGSAVPGQTTLGCSRARRQYEAYIAWASKHAKIHDPAELLKRTVYIGALDCASEIRRNTLSPQDLASQVQTPADPSIAPLIHLSVQSVEQRNGELEFKVEITNGSTSWMWSSLQEPLRVAWNLVPLDEPAHQQGAIPDKPRTEPWNARQDLPDDIAPGGSQTFVVTATLPKQPGLYRLEVTLVHELAFWFHDQGMKIATWPTPVKID